MKAAIYQYEKGKAYFQGKVDVIDLSDKASVKVLNCTTRQLSKLYSVNFKGTLLILNDEAPLNLVPLREYSRVVWRDFKKVALHPGVIYGAPTTGKSTFAKSIKGLKVFDTDEIFEDVFAKSKFPLSWAIWGSNNVPFLVRKTVTEEVLKRAYDVIENDSDTLIFTNLTDLRRKAYVRFTRPSGVMGDYLHHRDIAKHKCRPTDKWVAPVWLSGYHPRCLDFCFDIVLDYGDYISNYFDL